MTQCVVGLKALVGRNNMNAEQRHWDTTMGSVALYMVNRLTRERGTDIGCSGSIPLYIVLFTWLHGPHAIEVLVDLARVQTITSQ